MHRLRKPIIVYKRGRIDATGEYCVIKLLLPRGTLCRFDPRKVWCSEMKNRCDRARVVSIFNQATRNYIRSKSPAIGVMYNYDTHYVVGKLTRPDGFTRSNEVCAQGIHFFTSRKAAREYT